jgi:hypothetical protein
MNGRFFAGQQLLADFWDGITNFATGTQDGAGREDDEVGCLRVAFEMALREPCASHAAIAG